MSGIVEHALRALRVLEEITRPPRRPFADTDDLVDGAEQLAQAEEEQEVWEPQQGLGSVKPCHCGRLLNYYTTRDYEHEDDDRLAGLAAATYSSATPPADDPAGVEHPPVPPAGIPATADTIANMLAVEFWGKQIEDADQIGRIAADALLENFDITHK